MKSKHLNNNWSILRVSLNRVCRTAVSLNDVHYIQVVGRLYGFGFGRERKCTVWVRCVCVCPVGASALEIGVAQISACENGL